MEMEALRDLWGRFKATDAGRLSSVLFALLGIMSTIDFGAEKLPGWIRAVHPTVWFALAFAVLIWTGRRAEQRLTLRLEGLEKRYGVQAEEQPKEMLLRPDPVSLQSDTPQHVVTERHEPGPEFYTYVGRTLPAMTEEDLAKNRYGISLFVFNGNPVPIRLRVQQKKLAIRDPLHWNPDFVDVELSQEEIPAGKDAQVSIYVRMSGPGAERLTKRLQQGIPGDFVLGDVDIRVLAGNRDGRLRLPDGVGFTKKEQWSLHWIAYISGSISGSSEAHLD